MFEQPIRDPLRAEDPDERRDRLLRSLNALLVHMVWAEPAHDTAVREELILAAARLTELFWRHYQRGETP